MKQNPVNPPSCVVLRLEAEPEVHAGERVTLVLKVKNSCDSPTEVFLGGRPPHDFVVSAIDGKDVWRWSYGQTIQAILGYQVLAPGQELEFVGEWDQTDNDKRPVPQGTYKLTGVLNGDPPEVLRTGPKRLTILP